MKSFKDIVISGCYVFVGTSALFSESYHTFHFTKEDYSPHVEFEVPYGGWTLIIKKPFFTDVGMLGSGTLNTSGIRVDNRVTGLKVVG